MAAHLTARASDGFVAKLGESALGLVAADELGKGEGVAVFVPSHADSVKSSDTRRWGIVFMVWPERQLDASDGTATADCDA